MRRAAATTVRSTVRLANSKPQWPAIYNQNDNALRFYASTPGPRPRQVAPTQHILVSKRNKAAKKIIRARQDELKQKGVLISRIPRFDIEELRVEKSEEQRQEWLLVLSTITDPIDRRVSRKIFQILAVACRRLKATEVEEIVKLALDDLPSEVTADLFRPNIRRGILEIDDHGYVLFKSKYFQQMLVARRMQGTGPKNSYFWIEEELAHYELARVLLLYLGQYGESGPFHSIREQEERVTAYPLLRYAAVYWPGHCISSWSRRHLLISLASKFWTTDKTSYYGAWLQAYFYYFHPEDPHNRHSLAVRYLSWMDGPVTRLSTLGITEFVKAALEQPLTAHQMSAALSAAIRAGHKEIVSILLSHGADIKTRGLIGNGNYIHDVIFRKQPASMLKFLLEQPGCKDMIDGIDDDGRTPLHRAASKGKLEAVQILLENGATVDVPCDMGRTALHYAAEECFVDVVECLLNAGANPNGLSYLKTPLHAAHGSRDTEMSNQLLSGRTIRLLIKRGASPTAQDADGFTPLHTAVVKSNLEVVKALIPHYTEEDVNIVGKRGGFQESSTALSSALIYGSNRHIIRVLIDRKAKGPTNRLVDHLVDHCGIATSEVLDMIWNNFPEEVAACENATGKSLFEMMLYAFPSPNRRLVNYLQPLTPDWRETILKNYEPYAGSGMEGLVRAGAVNSVIQYARSHPSEGENFPWKEIWQTVSDPQSFPIWYLYGIRELVRFRPEFKTAEYLIPALCNSFSWEDGRETVPLFYMNLIEELPGSETPLLDYTDPETGATVLHQACESSHYRIVDRLITVHKANVNVQDNSGATPLMRCFQRLAHLNWKTGIIQRLLEHGADPTIRDNENRTAVTHLAMSNSWTTANVERAALELLMQHPGTKAVFDIPDSSGLRPIDYACQQNLYPIVKEFMDAGVELKIKDPNGVELLSKLSLRWSSFCRHYPLVEDLLSMGADIYAINEDGGSFIQESLGFYGDLNVIKYVMDDPRFDPMAPLPRREGDEETPVELPFHYAIKNCRHKASLMLILATPEQRTKIAQGRSMDGKETTSLHLSVKIGSVGLVRSLIEAGADVNAVDAKGRTPLFFINRRGAGLSLADRATTESVTCGYWLLKAGADPNFRNSVTGKTVYESIREYEGFDLKGPALRLLKDFGAEDEDEGED
ncbi:hypothetical protein TWF506_007807 [Arthrobotrys conoides]|uniref:Ankyrin repeat protein n=1 Tax=Arthrobotrys conoides TaxID=74498 RepID=A0AAN8RT69_9PEZI